MGPTGQESLLLVSSYVICEGLDAETNGRWLFRADKESVLIDWSEMFNSLANRARIRRAFRRRDKKFIASGRITTLNAIATCLAHQINNPLEIIQSSIDSLLEKVPRDDTLIEGDLQELRSSANRIHELIEHLYRLIKNDCQDRESLIIGEVLLSAYGLFEKQLENRKVTVELDDMSDPENSPVVYGNRVELEQVFINLFANARDALASTDQPKITVGIAQATDKNLTIAFSDNGEGISKENLKRVFDSLFTTKAEGTGLGLWLCFSVIEQMNGTIKVESNLGKGTTFTICLPTG
jgi:two-component system NtrC family sensor kinase